MTTTATADPEGSETTALSNKAPLEHANKDHSHKVAFPYLLVMGIPLLLGALLVAWGEKQLHSENANRYLAARELFRLTKKRLDSLFTRFDNEPDDTK